MRVRKFILFQLILFCVLFSGYIPVISKLPIAPEIPTAFAVIICPEFRDESPAASDVAATPNKIREERDIPRSCSGEGLINEVLCKITEWWASLSGPGELKLKDSQMPGYLRAANELALSGNLEEREKPGGITGGIAKMIIPGYRQSGLDPIKELTESEGQLVTGKIFLNNSTLQKKFNTEVYKEEGVNSGEGYYDLEIGTGEEASSNYQVEGRFGEISPLYDRFGFLKQALMPSAGEIEIPDENCIDYDPSVIVVTRTTGFEEANPNRTVPWTAYKPIPKKDQEGKKVPCTTDAEGNVDCPTESGSETYGAGGNLDVQTEVSLASKAWKKIGAPSNNPGGGGVFNVLLPPDTSFRTEQAESQLRFDYDTHSDLDDYSDGSKLYIADLGNIEGATSCIVDQLTAHPANAQYGACKAAFGLFAGMPIECTNEATPLDFANTASSSIAQRGWEIVNRLYQGFWCLWNWDKGGEFAHLFDEEAYRQEPNPPYPLPAGHSGNLFWCTELARRSRNDLSLSLSSRIMATEFGAATEAGGPSNARWISIEDSTYQNIKPGAVIFLSSQMGPYYPKMNHVGVVYSVDEHAMKFVQSNAVRKDMDIPVLDNGKISPTIGKWEIRGFGKP